MLKKAIFWLVLLGALGAGGYWGLNYWKKAKSAEPEYRYGTVTRGDLVQTVTASGQLNPVVTVQVGSQVSGIIERLNVDFNSQVTNGQVVAQLDPATFQANVHQSEGDLASAEASLELAQVEAGRAKTLFEDKLLAKSDYDRAVATLHQAEAAVKIKKASLEKSQVDLARTTIYSPIDGEVISREVDVGQTVAASMNAPTLFKIAHDLAKMQIDAMVSEADIGNVKEGGKVTFTVDAYPTRTFHGEVFQVRNSPVVTQNVVTYDTVIAVNNQDLKLKPGMTANVAIIIEQKNEALKIPNAALRFRPPDSATNSVVTVASTNRPVAASNITDQASAERPSGGGGRGTGGGGNGNWQGRGKRGGGERNAPKTVYVTETVNGRIVLKAVSIKTGISDGISTEVLEGLEENASVIVGTTAPETTQNRPMNNPFGGGGGFRR